MRRNIIIDCDPGIDDAVALLLAMANEDKLNILGITTVTGNQSIEKVTNNALKLVSLVGRDIKVAKGSPMPLIRQKRVAENIHGKTGMGNYELPEPKNTIINENAIVFLKNTIMASKQRVTIVPIGPLTNIALLLKVFPEVKENIEEIVMMGGAIVGGNITQTAEFNIWADPEAAKIVFSSNIKITMNGLDVTRSTGLYKTDIEDMLHSKGRVSNMCGEILNFYFQMEQVREASFAPIHDASAIMYLIHPELYEFKHMPIDIDLSEITNRGMTIGDTRDWMKYDDKYPRVLMKVDTASFRLKLLEYIYKLDKDVE